MKLLLILAIAWAVESLAVSAFVPAAKIHSHATTAAAPIAFSRQKSAIKSLDMVSDDDGSKINKGSKRKAVVKTIKYITKSIATIALATATSTPAALAAKDAVVESAEAVETVSKTKRLVLCGAAAVLGAGAALTSNAPAEITSGFGVSTAESAKDAVSEAVQMAQDELGEGIEPSIAFVSCTVSRNVEEVRKELAAALPDDTIVSGITSSGALLTSDGTKGGAVGCLLVKSSKAKSFAQGYDYENGAAAVLALKRHMPYPRAILLSSTPGAEEGILETIDLEFPGVPVYGGTAADDELSGDWRVMCRDGSSGTGVSVVGVSKSVKIGASMLGPYSETSKKAIATRTSGRRVYEINDAPAADWVYEWLGDEVKEQYEKGGMILPQTAQKPIGIKRSAGTFVTNHLAAFGGEDKYVDFFAPILEGSELVIMDSGQGPSTGYAAALERAYDEAKEQGSLGGADPKAGLLVFCGGMAIAVGENLDAGLTSKAFASKVDKLPMLGCTCFGEQAYLEKEKENVQRNLSVGMILFG